MSEKHDLLNGYVLTGEINIMNADEAVFTPKPPTAA